MFAIGTSVFGTHLVSGLVEAKGRMRWQRIEAVGTGERGRLRLLGGVMPERVERWRSLDSPWVLRPTRAARLGDEIAVALEDAPYPTIAEALALEGRFDARRAASVLLPVLAALEQIHAAELDVGLAPDEIALVPSRDRAQGVAVPKLLFVRPEVGVEWRARARGLAALAYALLVGRDPFTTEAREALEWGAEVPALGAPSTARPQLDPRWDGFVAAAWSGADAPTLRSALEALVAAASTPPAPRVSAEVLTEARSAGLRSRGAALESRAAAKKRVLAGVGLAVGLVLVAFVHRALDVRPSAALRASAGQALASAKLMCRDELGFAKIGVDEAGRVFGIWATHAPLERCLTRALVIDRGAGASLGVLAFDGVTGVGVLRTVKPSWRLLKLEGALEEAALEATLDASATAVAACALRTFGESGDAPLPVHFSVAPGGRVERVVAGHGVFEPNQAAFRRNTPVALCVEDHMRRVVSPPGSGDAMTSVSFRVGPPLEL